MWKQLIMEIPQQILINKANELSARGESVKDLEAAVSKDGKKVVRYSFRTGKQTDVLFDVNNTIGQKIESFEDYIMSPDGTKMLIQTNSHKIYRRSFTADFYIYTIASRKLSSASFASSVSSISATVASVACWRLAIHLSMSMVRRCFFLSSTLRERTTRTRRTIVTIVSAIVKTGRVTIICMFLLF